MSRFHKAGTSKLPDHANHYGKGVEYCDMGSMIFEAITWKVDLSEILGGDDDWDDKAGDCEILGGARIIPVSSKVGPEEDVNQLRKGEGAEVGCPPAIIWTASPNENSGNNPTVNGSNETDFPIPTHFRNYNLRGSIRQI